MNGLANDKAVGGAIFILSIVGILVYGALMVWYPFLTLRVTAFLAVAVLLGILAWIGYTMATTPPPEPIADIPSVAPEPKPAAQAETPPKQ